MVSVVVVCLVVAGTITVMNMGGGGGGGGGAGKVTLKCGNSDTVFEMDAQEYSEKVNALMEERGMDPMMMMSGPVGIECEQCPGGLAFVAVKDPKTGEYYIPRMR